MLQDFGTWQRGIIQVASKYNQEIFIIGISVIPKAARLPKGLWVLNSVVLFLDWLLIIFKEPCLFYLIHNWIHSFSKVN